MAEYIPVSATEDSSTEDDLTKCKICREKFDEITRIPRRLPCCVQSICQPCLEICHRGSQTLKCPMCRHQHHLPDGVESLPEESIILKILDHLKIQKRIRLSCTDCPESSPAIAQCDTCGTFLCKRCRNAHVRNTVTKNHTTATLDEIRDRPVERFRSRHHCAHHQYGQEFYCLTCNKVICLACTIVEHDKGKGHNVISLDEAHQDVTQKTDDVLKQLEEKAEKLNQSLGDLEKRKKNTELSKQIAKKYINSVFDSIIKQIKQRRSSLLSEVDEMSNKSLDALESKRILLAKVRSTTEYTKKMRSKADKIEELRFLSSSSESLTNMMEETAQDVEFDRTGVIFVPAHLQRLTSTVKITGLVRKVTFVPKERPSDVKFGPYNSVTIEPVEFPQVPGTDGRLTGEHKDTILPLLELDPCSASSDVTVTNTVITNTPPHPPPPDTGCRIQTRGRVMASRPLVVRRDQKVMFHTKVSGSVKKILEDNKIVFETAVTSSPVDGHVCQPSGLSAHLGICFKHKPKMCLIISYDGSVLANIPMSINNMVGESIEVSLFYLLDGNTNRIYVMDVRNKRLLVTVMNVVFDKPLWVMMYVIDPFWSDLNVHLISGNPASRNFNSICSETIYRPVHDL